MVDFKARVDGGRSYFVELSKSFETSWDAGYERWRKSQDLALGLALIHPEWWLDVLNGRPDIRGPRKFAHSIRDGDCQSGFIWDYACDNSKIELDHAFPYSLGGPTIANNALSLCYRHNRIKGHDVHLLPWDQPSTPCFSWVADQVAKVKQLRAVP